MPNQNPQSAADEAPAGAQATWAVAGPVITVKAIRAREVSLITLEIPDDYHVETTRLLYGRDALIQPIALPPGVNYGVWSAHRLQAATTGDGHLANHAQPQAASEDAIPLEDQVVFLGHVSTVKPIASRAVTAVCIEVPEDFHILATRIFYGRDALILPSNLPEGCPYGPAGGATHGERTTRGAATNSSATPAPIQAPHGKPTNTGADHAVRWLAIRCKEPEFWQLLGVHSEDQAVARVREICGVRSRAQILPGTRAYQIFRHEILASWKNRANAQARASAPAQPTVAAKPLSAPAATHFNRPRPAPGFPIPAHNPRQSR